MSDYGEEDRLSALPDSVIHEIFSYMETKEVIQTTILAKRWKDLWKSVPYLSFDFMRAKNEVISFADFIDMVLILRETSNIIKFSFICHENLEKQRVLNWLMEVLKRRVEVLELIFVVDDHLKLPSHIFTSELKDLSLSGSYGDYNIHLPKSITSAHNVLNLLLDYVKLPNGDKDGELILNCPGLRYLKISRCDLFHLKLLTIATPALKKLELICGFSVQQLNDLGIETEYEYEDNYCSINVKCPNLTLFLCICDLYWLFCIDELPALSSAHVSIWANEEEEPEYTSCLMNVLKGVCKVEALKVPTCVLQAIADSPDISNMLSDSYDNLRNVTLEVMADSLWNTRHAIVNLLKTLPLLETFAVQRYKGKTPKLKETGEDWGAVLPANLMFHSLESVRLDNSVMMDDDQKFLEFILERAPNLKQIVITATTQKYLNTFKMKLLKIPRASSDLEMHFRKENNRKLASGP